MTSYGLLLVDTSWTNQNKVEIDKTTHIRHRDRLIEGAKALIYVRAPIDAVVAEAEIAGDIIETETMPPDPDFNPSIPANVHLERELNDIHSKTDPPAPISGNQTVANTFHVPLNVTRMKGHTAQIPLSRLQTILGSDFSVYDETWIPLEKADYEAITALWSKEQVS